MYIFIPEWKSRLYIHVIQSRHSSPSRRIPSFLNQKHSIHLPQAFLRTSSVKGSKTTLRGFPRARSISPSTPGRSLMTCTNEVSVKRKTNSSGAHGANGSHLSRPWWSLGGAGNGRGLKSNIVFIYETPFHGITPPASSVKIKASNWLTRLLCLFSHLHLRSA